MTETPPYPPTSTPPGADFYMKPHRGATILVLGILGLVVCVICGIIAWAMGNNDLREIDARRMDPSGRGLTLAGKICGMIACVLNLVVIGIWILIMVIGGAAAVTAS